MTTRFDSRGNAVAVTIISATPNLVVGHRVADKDGYTAVQLGSGIAKKPKNPQKLAYKSLKFVPRTVREFRVGEINDQTPSVGSEITVSDFASGDILKVTGTSRGKGFAGVVKRWGFAGGPRTHGQSDRERAPGSIGQTTTPGRVYKGKKMAGHTGNARMTVTGVVVYDVDTEHNLLLVKGAIPGARNGLLLIEKVGSKKPLLESKVVEEEQGSAESENTTQTASDDSVQVTAEDAAVDTTAQAVEPKEQGSEVGDTTAEDVPTENPSDSPTPLETEESK